MRPATFKSARRSPLIAALAVLALCSVGASASAQGVQWDSLSDDEKSALSVHRTAWNNYPPGRQLRLLRDSELRMELKDGRDPSWDSLHEAERKVLKHHERDWDTYTAKKRSFLLRQAHQHGRAATSKANEKVVWKQLDPAEKKLLRRHRDNWDRYPPEKQKRIRLGVQRYLQLPPEQRQRLRRKFHQFQQLPPDKRRLIRERFRDRMVAPRETK